MCLVVLIQACGRRCISVTPRNYSKRLGVEQVEPEDGLLDGNRTVTFVTSRNLRSETEKGSRCASATVTDQNGLWNRKQMEEEARRRAIQAWERRWGPLPWEYSSFQGFHVSIQCSYEIAVWTDEPRQHH